MEILLSIIVLSIAAVAVAYFVRSKKPGEHDAAQQLLQTLDRNFNERMKEMNQQFNNMTGQVNLRLKENTEVLQKSNKAIGERLDGAAKAYSDVRSHLTKLEESNKRIFDVGKDIATLQEILKSPKLRGNLGEQFLGDLLSNLPKEMYSLQYTFKNGKKVDAVVHFKDYLVPVDSKFPLENFLKMTQCENEADKKKAKRAFIADVKKRIDETAQYIMPDEKTLDFALLYIPAENVYYEVIIKDEEGDSIGDYGMKKRVIPVSPNNFFVYLQTVLMGLRGMQIDTHAREIQATLTHLKTDFSRFGEDFQTLGSHLGNARSKYEQSEKRLIRLAETLEHAALPDARPAAMTDSDAAVKTLQ